MGKSLQNARGNAPKCISIGQSETESYETSK
jgi:hypothetical protein